jgi:hypothetical protein
MGKSSPRPPPAPDPAATARAQAEANRITQFTPQGQLQFGTIGQGGQFVPGTSGAASQVVQTPFQQALQGRGEQGALGLLDVLLPGLGNLQPIQGLPSLPGGGDFAGERQRLEGEAFNRLAELTRPEFERGLERQRTGLITRGLPEGSEAFSQAQLPFLEAREQQLNQAALNALQFGGDEQTRQANLALTTRGQGIGEQQALAQLAGILGGQITPPGSFFAPSQVDILGPQQLQQQNQLARFQAEQQGRQGFQSGLFGLGAAGISTLPFFALGG